MPELGTLIQHVLISPHIHYIVAVHVIFSKIESHFDHTKLQTIGIGLNTDFNVYNLPQLLPNSVFTMYSRDQLLYQTLYLPEMSS